MFDPDYLASLYALRGQQHPLPPLEAITPPRVASPSRDLAPLGESALARGEVAALLVAGGQGSRLGFHQPKGMYPVGPLSGKSLFQIHAEKVLAASMRHGQAVPLLIMTSQATHEDTERYLQAHGNFGLDPGQVELFQQGMMPTLCLHSGEPLFEAPGKPYLSPDGHGGALTALASSGLLERLRRQGIRHVFYFQVDNPLAPVADPVFLGHHIAAQAEVSSKVVPKRDATEKAGVFVEVDGRHTIIEYSDLPEHLAHEKDRSGRLKLWAASPAIHLFDVGLLARMTESAEGLPLHVAKKKVPHLGDPSPNDVNALKFERFIFDVLPKAERWVLLEAAREEEFAPLKNAEGHDSPESVREALLAYSERRLREAGARPHGEVEVSPLADLSALAGRRVTGLVR
jgi:UDP-N-acetylglucosamine/UDP-N-acetylgalactosamine diphosphorylase